MVKFDPEVVTILSQRTVETFYLFKVTDENGVDVYKNTTFFHDLSIGSDTYDAKGLIVGLDPPQRTSVVDREQYSIVLSDPDFSMGADLDKGMLGNKVELRLGFVSHLTKKPVLRLEATLLIYKGYLDETGYKVSTGPQGETQLTLSCSSPMADLDSKKGLLLTKDQIRNRNPNDSSCDQIYLGSGSSILKWGKI